MHPLVKLYILQGKSLFRRMTGNLKSVKGAFLFIFGVAVVGLWLAPSIWQATTVPRSDPALVLDAVPVILLTMCMLSLLTAGGEKAIVFTGAEIDFLFPGPFTRRQLLAYRIGKSLAGILFSSTLLSVVMLRHAASWPSAWLAIFLAMFFLQLFGMNVTLIAQSAGERAYTRTRKVILALVIIAVVAAIVPALKSGGRPGFFELAREMRSSRTGAILLTPLDVFGRLFVAAQWWPDLLKYLCLAVAIDGALLLLVFYLDADYLEAAAANSQAVHARLQRFRKGGLAAIGKPGKKVRGSVPRLPYLRGAGPIAWRQATAALRNARGLLLIALILAIGIGPVLLSTKASDDPGRGILGVMAWLTVIVGAWIRFDFRSDLDQMDHLKSLPASAFAIAAGQIAVPVLMMTLLHFLILASVAIVTRQLEFSLRCAAIFSLPFNLLLFSTENFIFLSFPTRAAANPADFQGYGRQILVLFVKGMLIAISGGVAALLGYVVFQFTQSWPGAIAVATIALSAIAVAMLPVVAWAFDRFDVSSDLPA